MVEFLGDFVFQIVFIGIFYWPGWVVLRTLTAGRYPPSKGTKHNKEFVAVCGLVTLIATIAFIYS